MDHLEFTIIEKFFDKYTRTAIPVRMLAVHEDYDNLLNYGSMVDIMIGRIEDGVFIEDVSGEWWVQNELQYPEAGESRMKIILRPTQISWLYDHVGATKVLCVHHEDDNLLTAEGILIGSRIKEEG